MSKYYHPKKTFIEVVKDFEKIDLDKAFEIFIDEYAEANSESRSLPQAIGVSEVDFLEVTDGEISLTDLIKKYSKQPAASGLKE